METKLTTFKLPIELHKKFKEIAAREQRDMTEILIENLTDYIKIHGDGNPAFELDKWIEQPKFKIDPALRRPLAEWQEYIEKNKDVKDIEEIAQQARSIVHYSEKKIKYGTTQVKVY